MTTLGDQVFQFGGAPIGGILTLPKMGGAGKAYFVDPANGDDGNDGLKPVAGHTLDTITAAYNKCTDTAGDVIYLLNDGNTSGSSRMATVPLTWQRIIPI